MLGEKLSQLNDKAREQKYKKGNNDELMSQPGSSMSKPSSAR